ncbi:Sir2 family NAD-dependent protein deacetylase [Hyphomicrobiales bacterium]|jgi:NAD-dependent deacetylase|nr:Sir2 family NAD-dependent protein deacetylase [Hyphomicrobiales bacterium]MDA9905020.1 Sir2 family NAD-dependent protein deacetylase [Hyphomicrobiales bacterium]
MSLEIFQNILSESSNTVVFTGAGISTESGIPDFRSPTGIWTKNKPIEFKDFLSSEEIRVEFWKRKFTVDLTISKAKPNAGHMIISELNHIGKVSKIITQNIDNLHQISGVPEENVIELHGNTTFAKCLDCDLRYELNSIKKLFEQTNKPPYCKKCSGIIKTATISFGQSMPKEEMLKAEKASLSCDLFIAIGSSLQVYPAASFPLVAKKNGSKLVILNREGTDLDKYADLVIHDEIGEFLSKVLN